MLYRYGSFLSVTLLASAACAQDVPVRRLKLGTVCKASLERFCPDLESSPGQTRNQIICLKPYRSSLPLACRSAVTAGLR